MEQQGDETDRGNVIGTYIDVLLVEEKSEDTRRVVWR
jgi:hypothetical protein